MTINRQTKWFAPFCIRLLMCQNFFPIKRIWIVITNISDYILQNTKCNSNYKLNVLDIYDSLFFHK